MLAQAQPKSHGMTTVFNDYGPNGTFKELKCICDKFSKNGPVCPKKQKTKNSHVQQVP